MIDPSNYADTLLLEDSGIWFSPNHEEVSYPVDGNSDCFQIEDTSFWFKHRNICITSAVREFPPVENGPIFDIGGGNGFVSLGLIQSGFNSVLVEPGIIGASNGKKRGIPTVICATTTGAGFRQSSIPAIGLFDVIEHIEDDLSFLKSMHSLLKPRGRLYLTVPAYSSLWSHEDEQAGHYRRYTKASISRLCEQAGFSIDYSTYIFRPLPLPILLLRAIPYRIGAKRPKQSQGRPAKDHNTTNRLSTKFLKILLDREANNIALKKTMNIGGSCLLVASA